MGRNHATQTTQETAVAPPEHPPPSAPTLPPIVTVEVVVAHDGLYRGDQGETELTERARALLDAGYLRLISGVPTPTPEPPPPPPPPPAPAPPTTAPRRARSTRAAPTLLGVAPANAQESPDAEGPPDPDRG